MPSVGGSAAAVADSMVTLRTTLGGGDVVSREGGGSSTTAGDKERRDSGSCDHTEVENINGLIYRDACTNTPSTAEALYRQLPGLENLPCPAVVSADRHGNELISIATQTSEIVLPSHNNGGHTEPTAASSSNQLRGGGGENIRGCAKASVTQQQLSAFYHGAWPITGTSSRLLHSPSVLLLLLRLTHMVFL